MQVTAFLFYFHIFGKFEKLKIFMSTFFNIDIATSRKNLISLCTKTFNTCHNYVMVCLICAHISFEIVFSQQNMKHTERRKNNRQKVKQIVFWP